MLSWFLGLVNTTLAGVDSFCSIPFAEDSGFFERLFSAASRGSGSFLGETGWKCFKQT